MKCLRLEILFGCKRLDHIISHYCNIKTIKPKFSLKGRVYVIHLRAMYVCHLLDFSTDPPLPIELKIIFIYTYSSL